MDCENVYMNEHGSHRAIDPVGRHYIGPVGHEAGSATTKTHELSDRLKALHYRRIRGDMIETYKIMTGKYDIKIAPSLVGVCSSVTKVTA